MAFPRGRGDLWATDCVKIVIDMNLSPEWEQVFSNYCESKHWTRIGAPDTPDEFILQWAKANDNVVLTNDLDFGAILAATHFESPSVFQIRSQMFGGWEIQLTS